MKIGTGLLDKMINGAFLNKRQIGRPLKYAIRPRGRMTGYFEMVFNPKNQVEALASNFLQFVHPYLAFVTYRFHVEKARENGIRIDDFYNLKFHKEPYFMNHVYAQNFHPTHLLERVRDVAFIRRPRTIFKGFKVPDWATAERMSGWEIDQYSKNAWDNAMHEFHSETTPMPFFGERQEPNPLQWFRLEQYGKGNSSRLYYNEVPNPWWHRHQGHFDTEARDELLYSFTHADQAQKLDLGIDTTTEEGREKFKAIYDDLSKMMPELIKSEQMLFPHEVPVTVPQEAHMQRVWSCYRSYVLGSSIDAAVNQGNLSASDAEAAKKFLGRKGQMNVSAYAYAKNGLRPDVAGSEGFAAADRAVEAIGLEVEFSQLTAESFESQFWGSFDHQFKLNGVEMREKLPLFISDPSGRSQVEAIMEERTQQLSA